MNISFAAIVIMICCFSVMSMGQNSKVKVTIASVQSFLIDPQKNLNKVKQVCKKAHKDGARMAFFPECMLTGHGGHPLVYLNAEPVPEGPLCKELIKLSKKYNLCICAGMAELCNKVTYNSQIVVDKGKYIGLQRKINLSLDEYIYFRSGNSVEVFDIGDLRFGITICHDDKFPEIALVHNLNNVDVILAPHAGRSGIWPDKLTPEFCADKIKRQQDRYALVHRTRAFDNNVFVLINNAVGRATEGLENWVSPLKKSVTGVEDAKKQVFANHSGTVMGIDPSGEIFLRTKLKVFEDEVVTVEIDKSKRKINHKPTKERQMDKVVRFLEPFVKK